MQWLALTNYRAKLQTIEAVVTDSLANGPRRFYRIRKEDCQCELRLAGSVPAGIRAVGLGRCSDREARRSAEAWLEGWWRAVPNDVDAVPPRLCAVW